MGGRGGQALEGTYNAIGKTKFLPYSSEFNITSVNFGVWVGGVQL